MVSSTWTEEAKQQQCINSAPKKAMKSDASNTTSDDKTNLEKMNTTSFLAPRDLEALKPSIGPNLIIAVGFTLYFCAIIWPPLLLLLTYILSKLIPYCFLKNDDAVTRRKLWRTMELQAREGQRLDGTKNNYLHRERFKILFPDTKLINLEENYWVNER
jgi:hypothetical protein